MFSFANLAEDETTSNYNGVENTFLFTDDELLAEENGFATFIEDIEQEGNILIVSKTLL